MLCWSSPDHPAHAGRELWFRCTRYHPSSIRRAPEGAQAFRSRCDHWRTIACCNSACMGQHDSQEIVPQYCTGPCLAAIARWRGNESRQEYEEVNRSWRVNAKLRLPLRSGERGNLLSYNNWRFGGQNRWRCLWRSQRLDCLPGFINQSLLSSVHSYID